MLVLLPAGAVLKVLSLEIRLQFAVESVQQVAGKGSGDPCSIVIGGLENAGGFGMVEPQQQGATVEQLAEAGQQGDGFLAAEIAQGTAGEKAQASLAVQEWMGGELPQLAVVATDAQHGHLGITAL